MAKLQVILDGEIIDEYRLTRGRVTIGRRRHCDILLDCQAVSGDHALIERIGRDMYVEDRESTNGTKLNGKSVRRQLLRLGDEIGVARYILRYCSEDEPSQPGFEKTMLVTEGKPGGGKVDTRASLADMKQVVRKPRPKQDVLCPLAVLRILSGPNSGKELELSKNLTTLGKVGVQVAVVTRRPQGYYLTHVEGANSLKVNGKEMGASPHLFTEGDLIEMMGVVHFFHTINERTALDGTFTYVLCNQGICRLYFNGHIHV